MYNIDISKLKEKYNLSQMEIIMLVFDYARVIKDNCYDIFSQLLKSLNINTHTYRLYGNRTIHSRCAIYVQDQKYDLNGIYFFDLGWSLKKDDSDDSYKYIYNYFAKTKSCFDLLDKELGLYDYYIGNFANLVDDFYDIALFDNYNELDELMIEKINNISEIVNGKSLNLPLKDYQGDLYQIYELLNNYDILLDKPISGEKFLEMLFNISKVKYLEGISDDFNLEYLKYVFYNSDWHFSNNSIYDKFRKNNYEDEKDRFQADTYNIENIDAIFKTIDFYSEDTNLENRINDERGKIIKLKNA